MRFVAMYLFNSFGSTSFQKQTLTQKKQTCEKCFEIYSSSWVEPSIDDCDTSSSTTSPNTVCFIFPEKTNTLNENSGDRVNVIGNYGKRKGIPE